MTEAPPQYAWLDGSVVPWDECVLHARTQGAFWGANVFEGLRAYATYAGDLSIFRFDDHLERLGRSMKALRMAARFSDAQVRHACEELLVANRFTTDTHIVVVAYFGFAPHFDPLRHTDDTGMHITALPAHRSPAYHAGASACTSSWRRIGDDTMPPRVKAGANYHNSRLAQHEAVLHGCDTSIILNQRGTVAEAPGACVVMVRGTEVSTPPGTSGVLEGITLASVAEIARDELGLDVLRREIDRTELYAADEVFLCGTLAEILPVVSVDGIAVGNGEPGRLTSSLQAHYERVVRGDTDRLAWLTLVRPVAAAPTPGIRGS